MNEEIEKIRKRYHKGFAKFFKTEQDYDAFICANYFAINIGAIIKDELMLKLNIKQSQVAKSLPDIPEYASYQGTLTKPEYPSQGFYNYARARRYV